MTFFSLKSKLLYIDVSHILAQRLFITIVQNLIVYLMFEQNA